MTFKILKSNMKNFRNFSSTTSTPNPRICLPKHVIPENYNLHLSPKVSESTFSAKVKILLSVAKKVNEVVLHSSNLDLKKIKLEQNGNVKIVNVETVIFDKDLETASIPSKLDQGSAKLEIEFRGKINNDMTGFYASKFLDEEKITKTAICTQFEPTFARRAFPCWDEPAHKATFDLCIEAPQNHTVLGNTPVLEDKIVDGIRKVTFKTSPVMSTYLLAWFSAEKYDCRSCETENGTKISVFAPKQSHSKTNFALEVAKKSLEYYEKYFGIHYPLPKLDMIALSDFACGAMENWGLVTYRDTAIYCNKGSSIDAQQWVADVVAHELAHQWFGNLVTMKWWSQLWLNEGFATFMQNLANEKTYPEFKVWDIFLQGFLERALNLDALDSSHPVEVEINHTKEIDEVFDTISYSKGASVLRMLHEYIGDKAFRTGVSNYLNKFSHRNTDSNDLWEALEEASNKSVKEIMKLFTRTQGFPMVKVKLQNLKKSNDTCTYSFQLSQSRFKTPKKNLDENTENLDKTVWKIPIRIQYGDQNRFFLIEKKFQEIELSCKKECDFFCFNSGSTGFFRVKQPQEVMENLKLAISKLRLPMADRYKILSDALACLIANEMSSKELLDLVSIYENESDDSVWGVVLSSTSLIKKLLEDEAHKNRVKKLILKLVGNISSKLGREFKESESIQKKKLRAKIISAMAHNGDQSTIDYLLDKFRNFVDSKGEIESDIFRTTVSIAVKHGGQKNYENVRKLSETIEDPDKKISCLFALGDSLDVGVLKQTLEYLNSEKVRDQDSCYPFSSVFRNRKGSTIAWEYFKKNYEELRKKHTHDSIFSSFVRVVEELKTEDQIKDAREFFDQKDRKGYQKALEQSFEKAELTLLTKNRELNKIIDWLNEHGY